MKIVEVTVGELPDFVQSPEYLLLDVKPITPLRAISQSKNPNASPSDLALVYACENNTLLGFTGLMPTCLNHNNGYAVSNTGWWINPQKGKALGLPLFLKAFNGCKHRMFFTDCSARTKDILDKTSHFTFFPPMVGKRWFLRFYTGSRLKDKGYNTNVVNFAKAIDPMLNALYKPLIKSHIRQIVTEGYEFIKCDKLDDSLTTFIENNSGKYFLSQHIDKLNWIINNPWVSDKTNTLEIKYPFSYQVKSFSQYFLVIKKGGDIRAVIFISIRDNHVTLPYYYGSNQWLNEVALMLKMHILNLRAYSMIVYNRDLIHAFDTLKLPAYYTKEIVRYAGCATGLKPVFPNDGIFQDGEADVVFT